MYTPYLADPDVHLKSKMNSDGTKDYSYLIVYVNDVICIDMEPYTITSQIGSIFGMKDGSIPSEPKVNLGVDIRKWTLSDDKGKVLNVGPWAQSLIKRKL